MKPFLLAGLASLFAYLVQAESLPPSVQKAMHQAHLPEGAFSLTIIPVSGTGPSINFQSDVPSNPASTMKLLTTYSAINLLGPTYQWPTELRSIAKPAGGVLSGDLYLKGYGDPKLTQERLWMLLHELRSAGIQEIRGDLVLDRSYFSLLTENAQFEDDGNNSEHPYMVQPDALITNFKSFRLNVRTEGAGVKLFLDPPLPEVALENHVQVGLAADCSNWRARLNLRVDDNGRSARIVANGSIPAGCSGERYLAALDHPTYTASLVKTLWREMGGNWQGGVRQSSTPANSSILASSKSPELPLVLHDINKYSNNGMARQVFLTLGAQLGQANDGEDTASRSAAVIRRWVASKGWNWPELVLENGAGLSRVERISTRHLAELLADAARGPWSAEFIASLPIVAVDGTMKKRLRGDPLSGEGHIKTGSLKDVRSVAGYVRDANGQLKVVVAILNHPQAENGIGVLDEALRVAGNRVTLAGTGIAR